MKSNKKSEYGIIVITVLGYIVIYELLLAQILSEQNVMTKELEELQEIVHIQNMNMLIMIIAGLIAILICITTFFIFWLIILLISPDKLKASKIFLATTISLIPGTLLIYIFLSIGIFDIDSVIPRILGAMSQWLIICWLIHTDLKNKRFFLFISVSAVYAIVNIVFFSSDRILF